MIVGGVREVDRNGRVQIPSEIRDFLGMDGRKLNVYLENGKCIIEVIPENKHCKICGMSISEGETCARCNVRYPRKGEE